jgi:hypothetical protein
MALQKHWGTLKDLRFIPEHRHEEVKRRADYLRIIFERNADNCKKADITIKKQIEDLKTMYGLSISQNAMSELRTGKRYKAGFSLIIVIRDYWVMRGIPFSLDV